MVTLSPCYQSRKYGASALACLPLIDVGIRTVSSQSIHIPEKLRREVGMTIVANDNRNLST